MPVVDVHAHFTPQCLTRAKAAGTTLHGIEPARIETGHKKLLTVEDRLARMDRISVDAQVVSAAPQMYCYKFDAATTAALHRECNDELFEMTKAHPNRFMGFAMLPMQDIDMAIDELGRAVTDLRLQGAMIGDHVNGRTFDEPEFRAFWKAAEELGAMILLHQSGPLVAARITRYALPNTIGNPFERTTSFAALVFGGVMDAYPDLKVCLAHGGGYVCFAVGRMDWGWRWRPEARQFISKPPSSYLDRFFYDSITHDERALRYLIDSVGIEQVVFGTDFPGFATGGHGDAYQPVEWLRSLASLTAREKDAILSGNAQRLFDHTAFRQMDRTIQSS